MNTEACTATIELLTSMKNIMEPHVSISVNHQVCVAWKVDRLRFQLSIPVETINAWCISQEVHTYKCITRTPLNQLRGDHFFLILPVSHHTDNADLRALR